MKKLCFIAFFFIAISFIGCNIFNPTESVKINSGDSKALTYEGYVLFRNGEYSSALDFFKEAVKADSTNSEAWYGLAKSTLNDSKVNVFTLLKYFSTDEKTVLNTLKNKEALGMYDGLKKTIRILDEFIVLDSLGKTDKKISFSDISYSYSILQLGRLALLFRSNDLDIFKVFFASSIGELFVDSEMLNNAGIEIEDINESFAGVAKVLETEPEYSDKIIEMAFPNAKILGPVQKNLLKMLFIKELKKGASPKEQSSSSEAE